ncbi:TPA: DUF3310 domain-containing protein [Staphylococcus pseudintermedius]|nr:DUF3310 domain-containing protein [Staphylococcus pseudintermedius]
MKIKDLKIGQKINLEYGQQRYRDTDDERWICEPLEAVVEVIEINDDEATVKFRNGQLMKIDNSNNWETLPVNKKIERPSHYGSSDIDLIDYWCIRYTPQELRGAFKSQMSKYIDRLGYKDEEIKELDKMIDYAMRYRNHLEDKR